MALPRIILFFQAQALLKSSEAYLKLDEAMHHVQYFRTNLHTLLNGSDSDHVEVSLRHSSQSSDFYL